MKRFPATMGVAAAGLITSLLTAVAVLLIETLTGYNIFSVRLWMVIPAGAALTGAMAASGFYFGSLYFHTRKADWPLLLQMVIIGGFTQLLIYYLQYSTLVLDNGVRASDIVPFTKFMDLALTKAHYHFGTMTDTGDAGAFGYLMGAIQFLGFLFGGLVVFGFLLTRPVCDKCNTYLRLLGEREKLFLHLEEFGAYYDELALHPADSKEFANLLGSENPAFPAIHGAMSIKSRLYGCPACQTQVIEDELKIYSGKDWKQITKGGRKFALPAGIDLVSLFIGK